MKYKPAAFLAAAVMILSLSSCGSDASSSQAADAASSAADAAVTASAPEVTTTVTTTTAAETTTTTPEETTAAPETTSAPEQSDGKYEIDAYGQKIYKFSPEYEQFIDKLTFVGDSICYGLEVYDYLPPDRVLAFGSVAARNIFDFTFDVNDVEYSITDAVQLVKPEIIIFSMGMNDINLTTPEQYCENYTDLLDKVHAVVPDAKLYVASITPLSAESDFNNNETIDNFNSTIKEYLANSGKGYGYVDISSYLKNEWNSLAYEYTGGDGIHLQSSAYSAILYQICEQLCG